MAGFEPYVCCWVVPLAAEQAQARVLASLALTGSGTPPEEAYGICTARGSTYMAATVKCGCTGAREGVPKAGDRDGCEACCPA